MRYLLTPILLPFLLTATPSHAQVRDQQFWEQINANVPLTPATRITTYRQRRSAALAQWQALAS